MDIRRTTFDALSARALHDLLRLRQDVFVVEQACPYADIDGRDTDAIHLVAWSPESGAPLGCVRCLGPQAGPDGDPDGPVRFGRLAVHPTARGTGLGRRLVAAALECLAETWPGRDVEIGAQLHLEAFYAGFGFRPSGEPYDDAGIPHIDMQLTR